MKRQRAEKRGRRGERLAALWLQGKGYRILARRARTPLGELDLVARRGRLIAIIEVKARPERDAAAWSIGEPARKRIGAAAQAWLARENLASGFLVRFDVVLLAPGRLPLHIRDAWRP
jgi:putative endonuclease